MRDLRNIYNDLPELQEAGDAYNEKYREARENYDEYDKLKKGSSPNKWKQFKAKFTYYTNNRCAICEGIVSKYDDVEHYRPKCHYWWLAYDFYNYYICCSLCNRTYKKTQFPLFGENQNVTFENRHQINEEEPLLYNPLQDDPLELFRLELYERILPPNGRKPKLKVRPNSEDIESYEYQKAKTTIDIYNLNNEDENGNSLTDLDASRESLMLGHAMDLCNFIRVRNYYYKNSNDKKAQEDYLTIKEDMHDKNLDLLKFVEQRQYEII